MAYVPALFEATDDGKAKGDRSGAWLRTPLLAIFEGHFVRQESSHSMLACSNTRHH